MPWHSFQIITVLLLRLICCLIEKLIFHVWKIERYHFCVVRRYINGRMIYCVLEEKHCFLSSLSLRIVFYQLYCSCVDYKCSISRFSFVFHQMSVLNKENMNWKTGPSRTNDVLKWLFRIWLNINWTKFCNSCTLIFVILISRSHFHKNFTANILCRNLVNANFLLKLTFQRSLPVCKLNSLLLNAKYIKWLEEFRHHL